MSLTEAAPKRTPADLQRLKESTVKRWGAFLGLQVRSFYEFHFVGLGAFASLELMQTKK
ncbi:hypothetical protein [Sutterella wadsworthensis]|uniref:hypothetical protein n=1 Tax=Sutterella wadsworthensis TaxID=40545 RepID=UPI003AAB91F3